MDLPPYFIPSVFEYILELVWPAHVQNNQSDHLSAIIDYAQVYVVCIN